jgi:hypothetical protein
MNFVVLHGRVMQSDVVNDGPLEDFQASAYITHFPVYYGEAKMQISRALSWKSLLLF